MFLNSVGTRARTKLQFLTLAMSLAVSGMAFAHPGDMAKSFGSGGSIDIATPDLAVLPGERIVVDHSNRAVFSYTTTSGSHIRAIDASGAVDSSFGALGDLAPSDGVVDMKVDSANRIVVITGITIKGAGGIQLSRYLNNGSIDSSFGSLGSTSIFYAAGDIYPSALTIDSNDNIFALGEDGSSIDETHLLVAKVDSTGSVNLSFGSSGVTSIATMPAGYDETNAQDIAIDHDGNIYLTGYTTLDDGTIVNSLAKVTSTGMPDMSFGGGASFVQLDAASTDFTFAQSIAIDAKNNVIVAGGAGTYANSQMFVARYLSDGTLDTSFNGSGIELLNVETSDHAEVGTVLIDGKNRIVLTGVSATGPGAVPALSIARLNNDGSLDTSFGHSGTEMLADAAWKGKGAFTHGQNILIYGDYFGGGLMMMDEIIGYDPLVVSPPSGF